MHHKLAFIDLDGTLNGTAKRVHLLPDPDRFHLEDAWYAWHAQHVIEAINPVAVEHVLRLHHYGYKLIALSMRHEDFTASTLAQLRQAKLPLFKGGIFKTNLDNRQPAQYKMEAILSILATIRLTHPEDTVSFVVVEDNAEVCDAVRNSRWAGVEKVEVCQVPYFCGE